METLESHYRDMCDIEFTIEQGRLFMLQTRVGKRTAAAALRMAVEMVDEGLIDKREAVLRVQPAQLDQLLHPQFDPKATYDVLAKGLNASPGAAVGEVYFTADDAEARHAAGEHVILVRPETSPDDLHGMIAAEGILTSRGGLVSATRPSSRAAWASPRLRRATRSRSTSTAKQVARRRHRRARGRRHLDRRHDRRGRGRRGAGRSRPSRPASSSIDPRLGRRVPHAWGCAPTPTCPTTREVRASSAPRASACAAPSTCSSATGCRSCSA